MWHSGGGTPREALDNAISRQGADGHDDDSRVTHHQETLVGQFEDEIDEHATLRRLLIRWRIADHNLEIFCNPCDVPEHMIKVSGDYHERTMGDEKERRSVGEHLNPIRRQSPEVRAEQADLNGQLRPGAQWWKLSSRADATDSLGGHGNRANTDILSGGRVKVRKELGVENDLDAPRRGGGKGNRSNQGARTPAPTRSMDRHPVTSCRQGAIWRR